MFNRLCEVHRGVNVNLLVYDKEKNGRKKGNFLLLSNLYENVLVLHKDLVCVMLQNIKRNRKYIPLLSFYWKDTLFNIR